MSKGKKGHCVICGKPIKRHDALRVTVKVGENRNQTSYREAHLSCSQSLKGV